MKHLNKLCLILGLMLSQTMYGQEKSKQVQPFLPQICSQFPNVRDLAMSVAGDEVYFSAQSYQSELSMIVFNKKEGSGWGKTEIASFSGKYNDIEPALSPDGLRLFFVSNRPLDQQSTKTKDFDIWYVDRKDLKSAWSEAINLGKPINTPDNEFFPSVSTSKNLYYTSDGAISTKKDDIFVSKWLDGTYQTPISLGDSINTEGYEFNAYISPDETVLIYSGYERKDGVGSADLYASYRKNDGQWTNAKNLGASINSPQMDYCPFIDWKDGILYFTSKRTSIPAQFASKQTLTEALKAMNIYENGLSRLYQVKIDTFLPKKTTK